MKGYVVIKHCFNKEEAEIHVNLKQLTCLATGTYQKPRIRHSRMDGCILEMEDTWMQKVSCF